MKFIDFLEEKITFIVYQTFLFLLLSMLLKSLEIPWTLILYLDGFLFFFLILFLSFEYVRLRQKNKKIENLCNDLEEKYLIFEVLPKSKNFENQAYYQALKIACKSMNDKISSLESEKQEYQEYIESFVHEIKTPISALSLVYDNQKNYELKAEIQKINNLIEQILYYARSDTTEHDYFIRRLSLSNVVHKVLLEYKEYLLHQKISLNIHDLENIVFTDEKWLGFILSQIIQNSMKYCQKKKKEIEIFSTDNAHNIILTIKDNGIGISQSDLKRVFEKGFTGSNRGQKNATGMGLYLSKKLADRLGLQLHIFSEKDCYTKMEIVFPKNNLYQMVSEP